MQNRIVLGIITLLTGTIFCGGCQAPKDVWLIDEVGVQEEAIVNGQKYSGHPSVGMLVLSSGNVPSGICTATLVGKKTVITAAHCIDEDSSHTFVVGGKKYPALSVHPHPKWDKDLIVNDIALVLLKTQPPIVPSAISTMRPQPGTEITLVGYGVTGENNNDEGVKRTAKNMIKKVGTTTFSFYGSTGSIGNTCYGDSGGPAFALQNGLEVQVGVTSTGAYPCGTSSNDTRVDYFATWVQQISGGDVVTDPAHPPSVDTVDNDKQAPVVAILSPADGATVGEMIEVKAQATDNIMVIKARLDIDGAPYSSKTAEPFNFPASLSPGKHTLQIMAWDEAGNQGASAIITVNVANGSSTDSSGANSGEQGSAAEGTLGGYGNSCQASADCQSGLCAQQPGTDGAFCTQKCDPQAAVPCPRGATCEEAGRNLYVCSAPVTEAPTEDQNPATGSGSGDSGGCSMQPSNVAPEHLLGALFIVAIFGLLHRLRQRQISAAARKQ